MNSRRLDYRVKIYGKSGKSGVVFFFCAFGVRRWQFLLPFLPIRRLIKAGYEVVCYDFNIAVGKESPQKSIDVLQKVSQDVINRAKTYKKQGVENISCYGISMGSLFAAYSAIQSDDIHKVILNLPYGDITSHITDFPGMLFLPKSAVKRYIEAAGGVEALRELMKPYSPIAFADKLSKKQVLLYQAVNDSVLKHDNTVQLKNLLHQYGTKLTYVENKKFDHYLSASVNNFKGSVYMKFLNDK